MSQVQGRAGRRQCAAAVLAGVLMAVAGGGASAQGAAAPVEKPAVARKTTATAAPAETSPPDGEAATGPGMPQGMPQGLGGVSAVGDLRQCVRLAAEHHRVNAAVLEAILRHESRMRPGLVNRNRDGSIDAGVAQINSIHWERLGRLGISPNDLRNPCVGTFVAAWLLSQHQARWGNTWWAVGAYHSGTPEHNARYQIQIWQQLVKMGAVPGPWIEVTAENIQRIAAARGGRREVAAGAQTQIR